MSRVNSYSGLQFALTLSSENSMAMTNYTNNVVFKSANMGIDLNFLSREFTVFELV